ncbi:hypothetical protein BON30_20435 [Cystobacter ferrugineus]|uniref:Uncharacterized protein n=2 Tax=Cystobacter ferrugineus TaxID=83449 RepID=A0A1L9B8Q2_9BACT|nr:hypothetical protein BON30_20435 [Cystobacter ferrugineus]
MLPLFLSLLLWVPRVGLAAQDAPLPSTRLTLSGPLADPESSPDSGQSWHEEPERYRAPLGLRLLTEVGAGAVTAVGGLLAGGLLGTLVCIPTGLGDTAYLGCLGAALVGGVLGLAEGYALGVWWGGESVGGDGSLLATLLGGTLGAALSFALLFAAQGVDAGLYYTAPLPFIVGSHLGYEFSQRPSPEASSGIQPVVSFSSRGALLGLGGRF